MIQYLLQYSRVDKTWKVYDYFYFDDTQESMINRKQNIDRFMNYLSIFGNDAPLASFDRSWNPRATVTVLAEPAYYKHGDKFPGHFFDYEKWHKEQKINIENCNCNICKKDLP